MSVPANKGCLFRASKSYIPFSTSYKKVHSLAWQFTEKFDYQGEPQEASCTGDEQSPVLENPSLLGTGGAVIFRFHCRLPTFPAEYYSESVFLNAPKHLPMFSTLAQLIRIDSTL